MVHYHVFWWLRPEGDNFNIVLWSNEKSNGKEKHVLWINIVKLFSVVLVKLLII